MVTETAIPVLTMAEIEDSPHYTIERDVVVGVDLGQSVDPTAIAVVERQTARALVPPLAKVADKVPARFALRLLERIPLQTPYPDQADYVKAVLGRIPHTAGRVPVFLDFTGVGRPVFDIMRERRVPNVVPVTIGFAGDAGPNKAGGYYVPKLELISRVQSLLHRQVLDMPDKLPLVQAMRRELMDFRVTYSNSGNAQFGARQGSHDDLILALALAVWGFGRKPIAVANLGYATR
ncbi:hypothetical protein INQ40_04835 [Lysobacter sp. H21R4]|uniref:hypothetical protein n=1 Tax=Lysobacter sp. H21R4 TaxID=2781021 RepID=UPI00188979D0|nr:hypothetical protein [Lysobacter sp. H21R4]QOY63562.1 hypothetical protein INQ40_04835 [Lysobacter sp. H21R4]